MVGQGFQSHVVLAAAHSHVLFRLLQGAFGNGAFQPGFVEVVDGLCQLKQHLFVHVLLFEARLFQFGFGCTYFIAVCTEMEERYAYVQKHREAAAVEQVLVADFQAVDVVVRTFHTDFGQEFAAVQLHLLLGDGHLLVQYGIFGAGGDVGCLQPDVLCHFGKSIGSAYICRQRFADVVAEVHGGQAQRIVGLADVEFAFVQLYLHFQHVVLGLESVFMGAFHVLH